MNFRLLMIAAGYFLLGACDSTERDAQEAIRFNMVDPESAKFRRFEDKANQACLEVNGKNSLGGYTGFQIAFLNRDEKGKWDGYISDSALLDFEYCVQNLSKADS